MKSITRKIDKLGRIVLPIDYRKALGLDIDSEIALELDGATIKLNIAECRCKMCDARIENKSTLQICAKCIKKIKSI